MIDPLQSFELPGGLLLGRTLYKQARFLPFTGRIEAGIAAISQGRLPDLERDIGILGCTVCLGAGQKPDPGLARQLCLGDRQYLMLCLACLAGGDIVWLHPECEQCGQRFDIQIRRSEIPVKSGGKGYPYIDICLGGRNLRFRVPNGEDELCIRGKSLDQAVDHLLRRCLARDDSGVPGTDLPSGMSDLEIRAIEQAMDEIAPDVGSRVKTRCPDCGRSQEITIKTQGLPVTPLMDLYRDIHLLAHNYGWHEGEILALPTWRRKLYIRFIDETRGMYA